MTEAPALPLVESPPSAHPARPNPRSAWSSEGLHRVEIAVPDTRRAALLVEYAGPLFSAAIVTDAGLVVQLRPPIGTGWVIELLALVDRWLEAAELPVAKLRYGGRSYLVRARLDLAKIVAATDAPIVTA